MIYVFLDTALYITGHDGKELIDPAQGYFPHLVRHAKNGTLQLVMPDVTKAEIETRICTAADRCREAISSLTLPLPSVELTPLITKLRKEYDPSAAAEQIRQKLEQFWQETNCRILTVSQIDTEKLNSARSVALRKCHLNEYRAAYVAQALADFRNTQMQPGDTLVAITPYIRHTQYLDGCIPDIRIFSNMHNMQQLLFSRNREMINLLNEGIHELELEERILEELDGFDFNLTTENGSVPIEYEGLEAELEINPETGKPRMEITGYEVIDEGSALLSFEARVKITLLNVTYPVYEYDNFGEIRKVDYITKDHTHTLFLSGWMEIWGKFDAEENIEFVEDVNDLEFDSNTGWLNIESL